MGALLGAFAGVDRRLGEPGLFTCEEMVTEVVLVPTAPTERLATTLPFSGLLLPQFPTCVVEMCSSPFDGGGGDT